MAIPIDKVNEIVPAMLKEVHDLMLSNAIADQNAHIRSANNMKDLADALEKKCLVLVPFCGDPLCEDAVRNESSQ